MIQEKYLQFSCAADLVAKRFVIINKVAGSVAYCPSGVKPDCITIGDERNLVITVQLLGNLNASFWFESIGVIPAGGEVEVGADGKGQAQSAGAIACYAKIAAVANSFCVGYNIEAMIGSACGTPSTGVSAVEEAIGSWHKTILIIDTVLGAIAGGAALGLGKLMYTLPAGAKIIKSAYKSMALDELDGNITADTPEVGLGTVVASGAVAVLSGTATFEDIITGQVAADCNGTPTVVTAMPTAALGGLTIEIGASHSIYFNVADTWAAGGEAACPILGTIVLEWFHVN